MFDHGNIWKPNKPARRGRGTPPTKIVFLGSRGWEPSITKSLSFKFQGRIWTWRHTVNIRESLACHVPFSKHRWNLAETMFQLSGLYLTLKCSTAFSQLVKSQKQQTYSLSVSYRLIFDCRARDTEIELPILFHTSVYQCLDRALVLKQKERITCRKTGALKVCM